MSRLVDLDALNTAERINLIDELWNCIANHPDEIPVNPDLARELDRRMAAFDADPSTASVWEDVRRRIQNSA